MLILAVGLFLYGTPTMANHIETLSPLPDPSGQGDGSTFSGHWDNWSVNATANLGIFGSLLASPPGSCTSVPNGLAGNCNARGKAALNAWATGRYFIITEGWSDLRESAVTPLEKLLRPPEPPTNMGGSWVPLPCMLANCGHQLRGDAIFIDENGDGKIDETWDDKNNNGIRETGEVDRLRGEQFSWGATSLIIDFNNLGSPSQVHMLPESGTAPSGLVRARVRAALGDNPECIDLASDECHISSGAPGVISTPNSIPDDLSNPNDQSSTIDNNGYFGICDPDRFTGDIASVHLQLDNCLWKVAATPVTAPFSPVTGEANAIRRNWIEQDADKLTARPIAGHQNFAQRWFIRYSFEKFDPVTGDLVPVDEARYQNVFLINQTDFDPNPNHNLFRDGINIDTYDYTYQLEHTLLVRRYGLDFEGNPIASLPGDIPLDPDLIGKTNPTSNPFWGADEGPLGFNTDFTLHPRSGVGEETGFRFLYAQNIGGPFISCFDCSHPPFKVRGPAAYTFKWAPLPGLDMPDRHPVTSGTIP